MKHRVEVKLSGDNFFSILALIVSAIYFLIWTYIDILQYETFNLHIWDVGVNFFLPYQTSLGHFHNSIEFAVRPFQPQKLIYFLVVPVVLFFPYPISIVIFQILLVAISGNFLFLTARKLLGNNIESIFITIAYLFNYSLFGVSFFPSHYADFFPVFFVISVYFQLVSKKVYFIIFLLLSAMSSSLAVITVMLYILLLTKNDLIELMKTRSIRGAKQFLHDNWHYTFSALMAMTILLFSFYYYGSSSFLSYGHISSERGIVSGVFQGFVSYLPLKVFYIALMLFPFGFVIYESKYSVLLFPYITLILISGFSNYEYFLFQYSFLIGTILFLSFADGLKKTKTDARVSVPIKRSLSLPVSKRLFIFLIIVLLLDLVILPFGPLNQYAGNQQVTTPFWDYNIHALTTITPQDKYVDKLISLIPLSSSVLIQENMPQLTNRQLWYEAGMYNFTPLVQYVIADPFSYSFYFTPPNFVGPYPHSMEYLFNKLFESGNYGVYASLDGNILLKKGFSGEPILYSPYGVFSSFRNFFNESGSGASRNAAFLSVSNETNGRFAFSNFQNNFFLISPGKYEVTFILGTNDNNVSNSVTVGLISSYTHTAIFARNITGQTLSSNDRATSISFSLTVGAYYSLIYFSFYNTFWEHTLRLYGAYLNQTGV